MNDIYHYPPDLFDLIVQTIPLLNRSKKSVLTFFKSAGVQEQYYPEIIQKVNISPDTISKYEISRIILERINQNNEKFLRERREIIKRIVEFEAFSNCWENDVLKAKGLVSEIQRIVNIKDSFTRMKHEKEKEQNIRRKEQEEKIAKIKKEKEQLSSIKSSLYSLFKEGINPQERGKQLESILNNYFKSYGILIREDFRRNGDNGEGIIEQIDGIIEIDNNIYFVEMKWRKNPIGSEDIFSHLGRIYHRSKAHGIFISASGYTASGIQAAKDALTGNALLVLLDLEDFVMAMESENNFKEIVKQKIKRAIIEKQPYK